MDIHYLDFIFYFVGIIIVDLLTPDQLKLRADRELGAVAGLAIMIIYSVIYIILFTFFFDIVDIINFEDTFNVNVTM